MNESTKSKPKSQVLCVKLVNAVRTGLRAGTMQTQLPSSSDQVQESEIQTTIAGQGQPQASGGYQRSTLPISL